MVDISKLSPVEAARRVHQSAELNFNPFPNGSVKSVKYVDELLRLTSIEVVEK